MIANFQLFSLILLLAAGQGLFLSFMLFFSGKRNWLANRYLGLFTLAIAITMVAYAIDSASAEGSVLFLKTLLWPRDFLYGPALYFYVRELTMPGRYTLLPRQWLHFLPAFIHALVFWSLPFLSQQIHVGILSDSIEMLSPSLEITAASIVIVEVVTSIIHVAVYLWLCISCLREQRKRVKENFSYTEKVSLNWLRSLLIGVIAIYIIWFFGEIFSDWLNLSDLFYSLLGAGMVLLTYTMSFLGLRQPAIFTGQTTSAAESTVKSTEFNTAEIVEPPSNNDAKKYKTSSLSDDLSQQLIVELQQLMVSEKPYLNSKLSLPELAEQLGVTVNYLSQIINEQLKQNFFEFVNGYRVNEAKNVLEDKTQKNSNILTIALESGFNSKSAFYTAFKKQTGLTPGQYRKQN